MTPAAAHAAALGLGAAAIWGAADFAGGVASRRIGAPKVVLIAHGSSVVLLLVISLVLKISPPPAHAAWIGLLSGVANGGALLCFYEALSLDAMGLPAAVAGVLTAALPVVVAMVEEGRPAPAQLAGFALAAVAIWLIAAVPGSSAHPRGLWLAVLAGLGFGVQLVLLHVAGRDGIPWAMTYSRLSGALVAGIALLFGGRKRRKSGSEGWVAAAGIAVVAGLFDTGGNALYTLGSLIGRLDVAAVLASLYPAGTIVLAAVVLRERTTRRQTAGMALALAAVTLISA